MTIDVDTLPLPADELLLSPREVERRRRVVDAFVVSCWREDGAGATKYLVAGVVQSPGEGRRGRLAIVVLNRHGEPTSGLRFHPEELRGLLDGVEEAGRYFRSQEVD